jgi:hypothetical protein
VCVCVCVCFGCFFVSWHVFVLSERVVLVRREREGKSGAKAASERGGYGGWGWGMSERDANTDSSKLHVCAMAMTEVNAY